MPRYGLVIDLKRCIGCHSCSIACKAENGTPPGVWWSKVLTKEKGAYPSTTISYVPLMCMQCKNAACVDVCPTGASYKRPNGIVAVDSDKCMGCKYCEVACPYGARTVTQIKPYYSRHGLTPYEAVMYRKHKVGVVEKCNLCMERVERGEEPACVATCPGYARHFGDLDDPNSNVSKLIAQRHGFQLLPELGTDPSVYYLPA